MASTKLTSLASASPDTAGAVDHICRNLRDWDRREIFACRVSDDPAELRDAVLGAYARCAWVATVDGRGAAIVGAMPMWPGVWSPFCFGTDEFPKVGLAVTRHLKRCIIPVLKRVARRVEVKTLEGHEDAQAWMRRCFGATHEATHPSFGKHGETFLTYAWLNEPEGI